MRLKIPQKWNSPKAQALIEYLRENFDDIPQTFIELTIRIARDELLTFDCKYWATDKDEVARQPEPSEAERENLRRQFYEAHVGPK